MCRAQSPADIVPRGDIAYDLLGGIASRGRIPGYTLADFARGDRLYTREEIAGIIAQAHWNERRQRKTTGEALSAGERALLIQFAPELHALSRRRYDLTPVVPARTGIVTGDIKARALTDPFAGSLIDRFAGVQPIGRDGFAAVSVGNWRDEWYPKNVPGQKSGLYPFIETAFVRVNGRALDVTVGKKPVRWGAGYAGALVVGDAAPSIPQISIEKSFLFPGTFGRHVGRLYFEEFAGEFWEPDDPTALPDARGDKRFLIARRLAAHGGRWDFSAAESMKTTDLPDPEFAVIYPALWFYHNDWTRGRKKHYIPFLATRFENDTYWKNYLGDVQAAYHADVHNGTILYADLLIDDIKTPTLISNGYNTPQKLGQQYGIYLPHVGGEESRVGVRLEYTSLDPGTYTNDSRPVTYAENGASLGFPSGPNARVFFGRVDAAVSSRVKLGVEGEVRRRKGNPFPGYFEPARTNRVGLYGHYTLSPNAFVGLRVEKGRGLVPNNLLTNGSGVPNATRAEINAAFGF